METRSNHPKLRLLRTCCVLLLASTACNSTIQYSMWNPQQGDNLLLHEAARAGNAPTVAALLVSSIEELNALDGQGYAPLHLAAYNGHAEVVKELLKADGIEVNAKDLCGRDTPLHLAAREGHAAVVKE